MKIIWMMLFIEMNDAMRFNSLTSTLLKILKLLN